MLIIRGCVLLCRVRLISFELSLRKPDCFNEVFYFKIIMSPNQFSVSCGYIHQKGKLFKPTEN